MSQRMQSLHKENTFLNKVLSELNEKNGLLPALSVDYNLSLVWT